MSRLFGRHAEVTVGVPGTEGRQWSGLRFSVKAELTRSRSSSTAEVVIYNLSADSRAACQADGLRCIVRMGYDADKRDGLLPVLVRGDALSVVHERDGADWKTTIKVADGERAQRRARVALAVDAQPMRDVMQQVTGALSGLGGSDAIGVGRFMDAIANDDRFAGLIDQFVADGPAAQVLQQLMPQGYSYTVTDGDLVLVPPTGITSSEAWELTPETGLVGSPKPRRRERGGRTTEDGIEAVSLLLPMARPGQVVRIGSRDINGDFVIREVKHDADTHETRWHSTLILDPR